MPSKTVNDLEREYLIAQLGLTVSTAVGFTLNDLRSMFYSNPPAGGGGGVGVRTVTAATTIVSGDDTVILNGSGTVNQALPAAASVVAGKEYRIINIGSGATTITTTISGAASTPMPQYEAIVVMSTGSAWVLVATTGKQALAGKAAIASPTFSGDVVVPTPDASGEAANKTYVDGIQAQNFPNQGSQAIRFVGYGASVPGSGNDGDIYFSTVP